LIQFHVVSVDFFCIVTSYGLDIAKYVLVVKSYILFFINYILLVYVMNIKQDSSFTDRIQEIIKLVGSAEKLASSSNMSAVVIGRYLSGKTDPSRKKIIALAEAVGVNIEWLATGNGPKKKSDRQRFDLELLTLIIGGLSEYEASIAGKLTAVEKTLIIIYAYYLYSDVDHALHQKRFSIMDTITGVENLFASLDGMMDTEKGREQAKKIFIKLFEVVLSDADADLAAEALIGAKLERRLK
jgi:transcriptional regulator with XRE-family HTH domain